MEDIQHIVDSLTLEHRRGTIVRGLNAIPMRWRSSCPLNRVPISRRSFAVWSKICPKPDYKAKNERNPDFLYELSDAGLIPMGSEPDDSVNHVWQTSQSIVLFLIGLIGIVPFIVSLYWIYRITLHRSRLSQHFWGSLDSSIGTNIRI